MSSYSLINHFPLLKPAISIQNPYEIDDILLNRRVTLVALIAIVATAVAVAKGAFLYAVVSAVLIIVAPVALKVAELYRANKVANARAMNEYVKLENPNDAVLRRIRNNPDAAKLLVQVQSISLTKYGSTKDETLMNPLPNFEVFKTLSQAGFFTSVKPYPSLLADLFITIAKRPTYLEHILTTQIVSAKDFPEKEQHLILWQLTQEPSITFQPCFELLAKHGFNLNAVNKDAEKNGVRPPLTPLARLVRSHIDDNPDLIPNLHVNMTPVKAAHAPIAHEELLQINTRRMECIKLFVLNKSCEKDGFAIGLAAQSKVIADQLFKQVDPSYVPLA